MRLSICLILSLLILSCRKDPGIITTIPPTLDSLPSGDSLVPYEPNLSTAYNYENIQYPAHMTSDPMLNLMNNFNSGNAITNEGAILGRVLFYDKNLSANNTISCASCHHQDKAFTDGQIFSQGFNGGFTTRNSMAVFNMNYNDDFFWDTRANSIEEQALMPIQHPVEMGMTLPVLEEKLALLNYYPSLFQAAFGTPEITSDRIATALGMFMKSIRSFQSKYDAGVANGFTEFTPEELLGKDMFLGGDFKCNNCHISQNFGGTERHNNGLDAHYLDKGYALISNNEAHIGVFKAPSLRNIELTAPYMHDGRFSTLEEVIEFYSTGVNPHPNLDDRITTDMEIGGPPIHFNFSPEQKIALIAFLKTLTDTVFISDPRYSNPFPN